MGIFDKFKPEGDAPASVGMFDKFKEAVPGTQAAGLPQTRITSPKDPFSYSPGETDTMRRDFVANEGSLVDIAKEYVRPTPAAENTKDFFTRVLPESAAKLIPRVGMAAYNAVKGQTDPLISGIANGPTDIPHEANVGLSNAGNTVVGIAQTIAAPAGVMGLEKAKEAWATDPVGSALAVAPVVKGGLSRLAEVSPLETIAKVSGDAANKLTDMTLKQPTTLKPSVRAQNLDTAHEGGFLPNSKGVDSLNSAIANTESRLAEGIANGDAAQVKGTLQKAIENVESLREKADRSSDPLANNKLIDAEVERLKNHPLLDENGQIDIGTLQKMKVEQGREIQPTFGQEKPAQFQNGIDKARIRGMKEELETTLDGAFPELAATNKQLGAYYDLKKSLGRAANRISNNQGIGIALPIKSGSGAAIGGMLGGPTGAAIGGGIGTLIGIVEHPNVAPRLARQLYNLSKGAMNYSEALKTVRQRIADFAFAGKPKGDPGAQSPPNDPPPSYPEAYDPSMRTPGETPLVIEQNATPSTPADYGDLELRPGYSAEAPPIDEISGTDARLRQMVAGFPEVKTTLPTDLHPGSVADNIYLHQSEHTSRPAVADVSPRALGFEEGGMVKGKEAPLSLRPSIMFQGKQINGAVGQSHEDMLKAHKIGLRQKYERGQVTTDGKFLTPGQAVEYIKKNQPGK